MDRLDAMHMFVRVVETGSFTKVAQEFSTTQPTVTKQVAAMEARLLKKGPAAPFTLPPEAVLKRVIHALESPRPRARYPVTAPTWLFAVLRRLLPTRALDAVLRRAGGEGRR